MWYDKLDKADKIILFVAYALRFALLLAMIQEAMTHSWRSLFFTTIMLVLTFIPAIIEKNYKITLPVEFTFVTTAFVYMTLFLGEGMDYYNKFHWWDKFLHLSSAIVIGMIGFLIIFELYHRGKIKMRPVTIALFAFCFSLALGSLWEIVEFSIDEGFNTNMQHRETGVIDTMGDLIVDAIGALISSIAGFLYMKSGKSFIFENFVRRFITRNPQIFRKTYK